MRIGWFFTAQNILFYPIKMLYWTNVEGGFAFEDGEGAVELSAL